MGQGPGDSGGPVFAGNGTPYSALGIHVAGTGTWNASFDCTAGTACTEYFEKWSNIEAKVGTLSPITP